MKVVDTKKTAAKKAVKQAPKPASSGLGLGDIGDLSSLLDGGAAAATGLPAEMDLSLIDEDPAQPRTEENPGFSEDSLNGLAESIKARGVKTPISLRENPDAPGRYLINHGARRFRATKRAGKATIPYVLDNDYLRVDQLIENLQREDNTPMEIAHFIERLLKEPQEDGKPMTKALIAKTLGRSPAFVTQHHALLSLPPAIQEAYDQDRVRDVTLINDLVTAWKKHPDDVEQWLATDEQEITRSTVRLMREYLEAKDAAPAGTDRDPSTIDAFSGRTDAEAGGGQGPSGSNGDEGGEAGDEGAPKKDDPEKFKKAIIQVEFQERPARLILNRRPPAEGFAWLKFEDDGQEVEANLANVKMVALIEG